MKKVLTLFASVAVVFSLNTINADPAIKSPPVIKKIEVQPNKLKKAEVTPLKKYPVKKIIRTIPIPPRFTRMKVGKRMNFIIDNRTQLVWEDTAHTIKYTYRWYSKRNEKRCHESNVWNSPPCMDMSSDAYATAATHCQQMLRPKGYENWRLPNIAELQAIASKKNKANHFLDPAFQYTIYGTYWSSSSIPSSKANGASMMHRAALMKSRNSKSNQLYVRCVHRRLNP